jgi:chorismate dehydratase
LERKIRIGAVSYLNTKPLLFGLEQGQLNDEVELLLDYPSNLVRHLKTNQIDIGLIPVGALPSLGEYQIVSDYCIGTESEVASVAVFSEVPMDEIDTVLLDYQSRTSVMLCRILFEKHWKKKVQFIDTQDESYINKISGNVAGLVIGDRALKIRDVFKFKYDLGLGWKEMTGLPFVFAVWVAVNQPAQAISHAMLDFCAMGLNNLDKVILANPYPHYDLDIYYRQNIAYRLSPEMKRSIDLYLSLL